MLIANLVIQIVRQIFDGTLREHFRHRPIPSMRSRDSISNICKSRKFRSREGSAASFEYEIRRIVMTHCRVLERPSYQPRDTLYKLKRLAENKGRCSSN